MAQLNRKHTLEVPELDEYRVECVGRYEVLAEFTDKIINKEFDHEPFVIHHNDLDVQNILVDEEFNITGILVFPGTVVPLPSLCVNPWMFHANYLGPIVDRDAYFNTFVSRESHYPVSLLHLPEIRKKLMDSSESRWDFELGLLGIFASFVLSVLSPKIYGHEYDQGSEFRELAETYPWFKKPIESKKSDSREV